MTYKRKIALACLSSLSGNLPEDLISEILKKIINEVNNNKKNHTPIQSHTNFENFKLFTAIWFDFYLFIYFY
jgi:hypothetical protein